ncbi:MAG: Cytochrome o ubiquinol oxidase subunit [Candidatus Saccharibacteria bacterium]|jgi:cytochrome o ubiquinol oxidase subunit 2|nr:Cytochrome o ubiquinol oxidase subunit [Candidatus Saccharibacteria bacterium]
MRKQKPMKTTIRTILIVFLFIAFVAASSWYVSTLHIDILNPKGLIALKEYDLLVFTTLLGFIIVLPVFVLAIFIAWRYRESNTTAKYTPNVSGNKLAEIIWWGVPIILITILSVVTWTSTHDLDPHKPLASNVKPITVQVIALDWKWLFIYPEQNIATVNLVQFPVDTPVNFVITADAPMNSFWIPQLSGQIYAMAGMTTKLHLNATETGDYKGSSANISGEGFSGMKFTARATSRADFDTWIAEVKTSPRSLTANEYSVLAAQSRNNPVTLYASSVDGLYDTILMKYMMPETQKAEIPAHDMSEMDHMNHMEMEAH